MLDLTEHLQAVFLNVLFWKYLQQIMQYIEFKFSVIVWSFYLFLLGVYISWEVVYILPHQTFLYYAYDRTSTNFCFFLYITFSLIEYFIYNMHLVFDLFVQTQLIAVKFSFKTLWW